MIQTDLFVLICTFIAGLALMINVFLKSLLFIYGSILIVLCLLVYATIKSEIKDQLKELWILGLLSLILYPPLEYLFVGRLDMVTYLTNEPTILLSPVYPMLFWLFGVVLFGYIYIRSIHIFKSVAIAVAAVSFFSAINGLVAENLFNYMGFYRNNVSSIMIVKTPVYLPLGYMVTFAFMPLYLKFRWISGLLLFGIICLCWLMFSLIL